MLSDQPEQLGPILQKAATMATNNNSPSIELGFVIAALMLSANDLKSLLAPLKLVSEDIEVISSWLARSIETINHKRGNLGGIGRDWSFGFTNFLNRFAYNISLEIVEHNLNFGWLTESEDVAALEAALTNNSGAIAIIGPTGIGKTSRVYAFAQRMIEGKANQKIVYHQILQLDAGAIITSANKSGGLENIFRRIVAEASNAGHVILFLDDAELFFQEGPGSMNASAILQPMLQNRSVQFILAFTPEDYQRLRTNNSTFANLLTPIMLRELPQHSIMNILEDSALGMESRYNCLISLGAIKTAYRLSDRFDSEGAFPGKAIKLLDQSISYSDHKIVNQTSVERAIEHSKGVKVTTANATEADTLLHLEERIHQRMINQNEAVISVSAALRRARAGVGDPKRPIGSFLFLGPTGVGKTELAKAIAATYFGSVDNIIRLDMSEYQQEKDVSRLLATGSGNSLSFIMAIRAQPFAVVLLDEVEKAHPAILNLLLQLLDEGQLTDVNGKTASFKDAVIIATSNAGAKEIRQHITSGGKLEDFKEQLTDVLVQDNIFKVELLNRFDEIVLFRPLSNAELGQVVALLLREVNANLSHQGISITLSDKAVAKIVAIGTDERFGARPMRRALQRGVEDSVAQKILSGEISPGQQLILDADQIDLKA